jgi:phosphoenolpyruvate synthase/pyruvate phosphate dikinase
MQIDKDSYNINSVPPFTEWLKKTNLHNRFKLIEEDDTKRFRLDYLHYLINLPYDIPEKMMATDITNNTPIFQDALKRLGDKMCALRLIPKEKELPKYRLKALTLKKGLVWFYSKKIDANKYLVEIVPRTNKISLSSIFIINDNKIWGEINQGRLRELSEGNCKTAPIFFSYDFKTWQFSKEEKKVEQIIKKAISCLQVTDNHAKNDIKETLKGVFNQHEYLKGYFEFMVWPNDQIKFFDYNRLQDTTLHNFNIWQAIFMNLKPSTKESLHGICASPGYTEGIVKIIENPTKKTFNEGDILVCKMTSIEHMDFIQKAGAIINEQGTILSHSAVISRELKKPCIIRVKNATDKLKDGDKVIVNATNGIIKII